MMEGCANCEACEELLEEALNEAYKSGKKYKQKKTK